MITKEVLLQLIHKGESFRLEAKKTEKDAPGTDRFLLPVIGRATCLISILK